MIPQRLIEVVKHFEGFHPMPYLCPAGLPTVGYGHVIRSGDRFLYPLTEEEAEEILIKDLSVAVSQAVALSPLLGIDHEDRLSAISSFIFNLGGGRYKTSTLRKKVNVGDWASAAREIVRWIYGGGRPLRGLVRRRAVEAFLLLHPGQDIDYANPPGYG